MNRKIIGEAKLPKDSAKFLKGLEVLKINPHLSQNRFLVVEEIKKKKDISILFSALKWEPVEDYRFCEGELVSLMQSLNSRTQMLANTFPKQGSYLFQPYDKLILGTGGNSPYGTIQLIKLHHVYGIPYLPASTIKGAVRNCWILKEFGGDQEKAEQDEAFRTLFGTAGEDRGMGDEAHAMRGALVFFDCFPKKFTLGLDIQTSHYPRYYSERKSPTDDQPPIPIYLTCLQGIAFEVILACERPEIWIQNEKKMEGVLEFLFLHYGIGAKTALGYGVG